MRALKQHILQNETSGFYCDQLLIARCPYMDAFHCCQRSEVLSNSVSAQLARYRLALKQSYKGSSDQIIVESFMKLSKWFATATALQQHHCVKRPLWLFKYCYQQGFSLCSSCVRTFSSLTVHCSPAQMLVCMLLPTSPCIILARNDGHMTGAAVPDLQH